MNLLVFTINISTNENARKGEKRKKESSFIVKLGLGIELFDERDNLSKILSLQGGHKGFGE